MRRIRGITIMRERMNIRGIGRRRRRTITYKSKRNSDNKENRGRATRIIISTTRINTRSSRRTNNANHKDNKKRKKKTKETNEEE